MAGAAPGPNPNPDPEGEAARLARAFLACWSAHDAEALAALFARDADFVNVAGLWWHGAGRIGRTHGVAFRTYFAGAVLTEERLETRALGPFAAIARVRARMEGQIGPDGAAAGLLARRAIAEGAWISAANQPIAGGVALSPRLPRPDAARLIDLQLNPLVAEPGGFVILNADTLSRTEELRPLPVRRLMILLRRLALREAQTYVFEPNSDDFRALVRRRFERLLSLIHQRGGLKGATPAAAFRVETGASVNPATAIDEGRFLVELRVAPSRPFRHLTVLLLQTGPQQVQVREA